MSTVVFATWDGAGNLPPALAVAAELGRRGHRVEVLGHDSTRPAVEAAGLVFHPYPSARQWDADRPAGPLAMVRMFGDRAMGRDVVDRARRVDADVVVADCMLFGVMRELGDHDVPYVALEHVCDGFLRKAAKGPFGLALRAKGLHPIRLVDGAAARMVLTIPELDRGHGAVTHVGPVVRGAPSAATEPAVLVSLSTYRYPGMDGLWQRVLDAVDGLPARVVATTGPRVDPADLRVPSGVEVHRWLDHSQVLPTVTAAVCHGGHGTTVAALAHGLPLLVLPLDRAGDQPYMGASVSALGAGRSLRKSSSPAAIRSALEELLGDPSYRANADRLAASIDRLDGRRRGADLVEALVSASATPGTGPD